MIPTKYFITRGAGQSDYTHHAGSYHMALHKAGISECNIMTYSSILSPISEEIQKPILYVGQELKCIQSVCFGTRGSMLAAGIGYNFLYFPDGKLWGGLVVERQGSFDEDYLVEALENSWHELYNGCFTDLSHDGELKTITQVFIPDKNYGCALVAMCFTDFKNH